MLFETIKEETHESSDNDDSQSSRSTIPASDF